MATASGRPGLDLSRALRERPQSFAFFQAVRLIARFEGRESATGDAEAAKRPGGPLSLMTDAASGLGPDTAWGSTRGDAEAAKRPGGPLSLMTAAPPATLRFRTPPNLAFPASEVLRVTAAAAPEGKPPLLEMEVGFLGLTGPSGALPSAYTELVSEQWLQRRDPALHAFFDLFSHRAVSLFYAAWFKHRPHLALEAGQGGGFSQDLLDISGLSLKAGDAEAALAGLGAASAFFAGLVGRRPIPSRNLPSVVEGFLGAPARLEQFVGQWIEVPPEARTALGNPGEGLGHGAFLGGRQRDCQNAIRLDLGPLDAATFRNLLPGGPQALQLQQLLRRLVGPTLTCQVRLVLRGSDIPPARMNPEQPLRLGWNAWLPAPGPFQDRGDTVFEVAT